MTSLDKPEKKRKRRAKSLIRKNLKQSLRTLPFIFPLLITAFVYAWFNTRTNIIALPIEDLRREKADLKKHTEALRLNIEQLQAPQRIEKIAREKLGMSSPEMWQVVVLDKPVRAPETAVQVADLPAPKKSANLLGSLRDEMVPAGNSALQVSPQTTGQPG